jgi:hypothetical protein
MRGTASEPRPKAQKTAQELAVAVAEKIGVKPRDVHIQKDRTYGWRALVILPPGQAQPYQQEADQATRELRAEYDLA